MLWLISSAWANRRLCGPISAGLIAIACPAVVCRAQVEGLRPPASVVAGRETSIATTGSGKATFYLAGPSTSTKREVSRGEDIRLQPAEVQSAGRYVAVICSQTCQSAAFYVTAAKPSTLSFLVHPSRVPVGQSDRVSGVALPFDPFHNLVVEPVTIDFRLTAGAAPLMSRPVRTRDGVAWFRASSGKSAGALEVAAALNDLAAHRVVRQVASDPCNLRIKGQRTAKGLVVETEPVHDCGGNPVPDGTIVTFTATEASGKSTVDAPIKQGIARAQIAASGPTVISVASGIVMGNELRLEAPR
jgi:hypothetical protein